MKILITGGAGFIGSSLILQLQDRYDIVCLGRSPSFSKLKKLVNKNVTFVKCDVSDEAAVSKQVKGVDSIIHLAGGGGNASCIQDPVWALNTHVKSTHLLAKLAVRHGVKKFIFASSYLVYGAAKQNKHSVKETATLAPESFYANLKDMAEQIIVDSGLNYSIVRFANVYGYTSAYKLQSSGAINNFIRACLDGKSIQIQGSGKQHIDYVHIQDIVQAIISILEKGSIKSIYNIGSGKSVSIYMVAKTALAISKKLYKKNTPIRKIKSSATMGQSAVLMSIKKARKELKWNPKVDLETGISELMHKNKPALFTAGNHFRSIILEHKISYKFGELI